MIDVMSIHLSPFFFFRYSVVALMCLLLLPKFAEAKSVLPFSSTTKFYNLGVDQGVSQGSIYSILQDDDGFIWLASQDGLNRFDGQHFEVFSHENNSGPSDGFTTGLLQDNNDQLWIATLNGVTRYSLTKKTWEYFFAGDEKGGLPSNRIKSLHLDKYNRVWAGTTNGLAYYQEKTGRFVAVDLGRHENSVEAITDGKDDDLWLATTNGLYQLNIRTLALQEFLLPSSALTDAKDKSAISIAVMPLTKDILVGTHFGLYLFTVTTKQFSRIDALSFLNDQHIQDLMIAKNKSIWIASSSGLHSIKANDRNAFFDLKSHYREASDLSSLSSNNVLSLFQDRNDNIWVGTVSGISILDANLQLFKHYVTSVTSPGTTDKSGKEVYSLFEDKNNNIWVGTDLCVSKINASKEKITIYPEVNGRVSAVQQDLSGNIWLGGANGLYKLVAGEDVFKVGSRYFESKVIYTMLMERNNLWIGSAKGLFLFNTTTDKIERSYYQSNEINSLSDSQIYSLATDVHGDLWVGTIDGLNRLDKNGNIKRYFPPQDSQRPDKFWVFAIAPQSDGLLWLSTMSGLYKFDPSQNKFERFSKLQGLQNESLFGLLIDKDKKIWVSSNKGLSFFDSSTMQFVNYTKAHGLQSSEFNFGAYAKLKNGEFVFGGVNGLNVFSPKTVSENLERKLYTPTLVELKISNKIQALIPTKNGLVAESLNRLDNIQLTWRDSMFSIEFEALDFVFGKSKSYRYRMSGFDNEWVYVSGEKNYATYTNLDAGQYKFEVQSGNNYQQWSDSASISVIILSPPWRSPWAYAVYFISVLLVLVGFIVLRERKAKAYLDRLKIDVRNATIEVVQKNKELEESHQLLADALQAKDQFFRHVTHELRTPLTLLQSPVDILLINATENQRKWLTVIKQSSLDLKHMVDNLLGISALQKNVNAESICMLPHTMIMLAEQFSGMNQEKAIVFSMDEVPNCAVKCDANELKIMVSNLISNAIKYTPHGGFVGVSFDLQEAREVIITVRDNGFGISDDDQGNIFNEYARAKDPRVANIQGSGIGLSYVKKLALRCQGDIKFSSKLNEGSSFYLSLPIGEHTQNVMSEPLLALDVADSILFDELPNDKVFSLLIIEDNPHINDLICSLFNSRLQCFSATNVTEGLKLAKEHMPDVIITDLMMPISQASDISKSGGLQVCSQLKQREETAHIPIIMLTALTNISQQLEGLQHGADDYICKPFNNAELQLRIYNRLHQLWKIQCVFTRKILDVDNALLSEGAFNDVPATYKNLAEKISVQLRDNFHNSSYCLKDLADAVHKSERTLQNELKAMGANFSQLLLDYRLMIANKKLAEGMLVSKVAFESGFNEHSYFTKCYKAKFGITPKQKMSKLV